MGGGNRQSNSGRWQSQGVSNACLRRAGARGVPNDIAMLRNILAARSPTSTHHLDRFRRASLNRVFTFSRVWDARFKLLVWGERVSDHTFWFQNIRSTGHI